MSNLGKYQSANPLKRFLLRRFLRKAHARLPDYNGFILDVGTGEGLFWDDHTSSKILGIDIRHEALVQATANPHLSPVEASADNLPFRSDSFGQFVAIEILEHLQDPHPALEEIARVSAGRGLISVPWEPWFSLMVMVGSGAHLRRLGREPEHVQAFGPKELRALLGLHFDVVDVHPVFPWLLAEVGHERREDL